MLNPKPFNNESKATNQQHVLVGYRYILVGTKALLLSQDHTICGSEFGHDNDDRNDIDCCLGYAFNCIECMHTQLWEAIEQPLLLFKQSGNKDLIRLDEIWNDDSSRRNADDDLEMMIKHLDTLIK